MPSNRIVARFRDGSTLKGQTSDFFPNKAQFHLSTRDGQIHRVTTSDLKAIFFVRDHDGDRLRKDDYNEEVMGVGRKIQVTFSDGETITGYTAGYSKDRPGFFLVPANTKDNNERMFIVNANCKEARLV